jgi:hypothetical protein
MRRLILLVLTLFPCFTSCLLTTPAEWTPVEVPLCSRDRLWEIARMAMEQDGFVLSREFDPKTHTVISSWDKELHPFKGHGYRERAHLRYEAGETPGTLLVSMRVEREINENLSKPFDPQYADWAAAPDNPERAAVVLQYIRSMLGMEFKMGGKEKGRP